MVKERTIVIKDVFRRGDNKIKEFNGYHAIAYAGIQLFYNHALDEINTNLNMLYQKSNIEDKRTKKNIKQAVNDLVRWELISLNKGCSIRSSDNIVASIPIICSSYTSINTKFILKILKSEHQIDFKGNMVLVYIILAQYMGNDVIAYPSMETISKDSGLSIKTVNNVLRILKELKIIEYGNNNTYNGYLVGNIYIFCDTPNYNDILKSEMSQLTSAEANKEKWLNVDCSVYIVRLYDEYENFYKIGITVDVPRRLGQIPYKHEIIKIIETNMYEAYYLENELQEKHKQYRYFPAKDFDGKTECFHYIY